MLAVLIDAILSYTRTMWGQNGLVHFCKIYFFVSMNILSFPLIYIIVVGIVQLPCIQLSFYADSINWYYAEVMWGQRRLVSCCKVDFC